MGFKRRLPPGNRPTWQEQLTYHDYEYLASLELLGTSRLRRLAAEMDVPLDGVAAGAICLAAEIIATIEPESIVGALTSNDLARIGPRVMKTKRYTLAQLRSRLVQPAPLGDDLDDAEQSDATHYDLAARDSSCAGEWPELASPDTLAALPTRARRRLLDDIARGLGGKRRDNFVELQGRTWCVIPGGRCRVGASAAELRALKKAVRSAGPEAHQLVDDMTNHSTPQITVTVPAFLCRRAPVRGAELIGEHIGIDFDDLNAHRVAVLSPSNAAKVAAHEGARLLTESEWEHVARAGTRRSFLADVDEPPTTEALETAVRQLLAGELEDDPSALGPAGLAWGTWVADRWSPRLTDRPTDGSAARTDAEPVVTRGVVLQRHPFQVPGEPLLLHVAYRCHAPRDVAPVLLARDLPGR